MKILIAYGSGTGTTEDCAKYLAQKLGGAEVVNLKKRTPSPNMYDTVIVGAPVRAGKIPSYVKKYLKNNELTLMGKKCAYFVCCGDNDYTKYMQKNFPQNLLNSAVYTGSLGAEYRLDKAKGFDKLVCKIVIKLYKSKDRELPQINYEEVGKMTEALQA